MGETSVQVSFCDGGNLNGSIDEMEFVRLRVRASLRQDSKHARPHLVSKVAPLVAVRIVLACRILRQHPQREVACFL
jgi:hypothetical protein